MAEWAVASLPDPGLLYAERRQEGERGEARDLLYSRLDEAEAAEARPVSLRLALVPHSLRQSPASQPSGQASRQATEHQATVPGQARASSRGRGGR